MLTCYRVIAGSRAYSPNLIQPSVRRSPPIPRSDPRSDKPTAGSSTAQTWEIVPILNRFAPSRRLAKIPCIMMETPVRNKDFYGRDSILQQLDQALLPSDSSFSSESELKENTPHKHVVLCGMGGLGKTSIATEFAFRHVDDFDAIFWVRADEVAKLGQGSNFPPYAPVRN